MKRRQQQLKHGQFQKEVERFALNIRGLRKSKGLTQQTLAEACGLDEKQIGFLEQGRRSPNFKTILALQKGLGCKLKDLFTDITE